jgi:hypothetical protein
MRKGFLFLAVVSALALAGVAAAHVFSASPSLTINKLPRGATAPGAKVIVYGRIVSGRSFCKSGRIVRLYRVRPGPNPLLATDVTDREGEYFFSRRPRRDQTVYTRISRLSVSSYGHLHQCARARSSNLFINVR